MPTVVYSLGNAYSASQGQDAVLLFGTGDDLHPEIETLAEDCFLEWLTSSTWLDGPLTVMSIVGFLSVILSALVCSGLADHRFLLHAR